ncbi:MAG TPA: hypothetical protein VGN18_00835 [Jatrophihabitans sp.]|jgi:hypothetical protein|uniref:hypothetical protein n=1 Tax=Jatrophihabitans sp. TaxID=1932789 RepID=UPI002E044322|nr:hypothetical protein [Jatrophihabitans sp.]
MRPRRLIVTLLALTACASARPPDRARSGCYEYSIAADRDLYRAGQTVHLTVEARNVTSHSCPGPRCRGITPWFEIIGADRRTVFRTYPVGVECARPTTPPPVVRPGHGTVWDTCTWSPAPPTTPSPDRYTARWHWLDAVSVDSPVIIVTRA